MKKFITKSYHVVALLSLVLAIFGQAAFGGSNPINDKSDKKSKTDNLLPRIVQVVNTTTSPGQTVVVSISVNAEGDEANYGFSLNYNTAILSNPVVAIGNSGGNVLANTCNPAPTCSPGQIGFNVDFGGGTIAQGNNRQLVTVTFNVAANAPGGNTPLNFGDTPAIRRVSNTAAQPLTTTFSNGVVTIAGPARDLAVGSQIGTAGQTVTVPILADTQGDERAYTFSLNYNTAVLSNPVVMLGTGATGATLTANTCNPSPACSPGQIGFSVDFPSTIAAGTDLQLVTIRFNIAANAPIGQTPLTFGDTPAIRRTSNASAQALPTTYTNGTVTIQAMARTVRVGSRTTSANTTVTVSIFVDAIGDEANYGFSLNYNTAILSNPVVAIGNSGGNVLANTCNPAPTCSPGQIGFNVDFGGGTIAAGNGRQLVTITFNVAPNAPAGDTPLTFADTPAIRRTSNTAAQPLPTSYVNGVVTILAPTAASARIAGRVGDSAGNGLAKMNITITHENGETFSTVSNSFGFFDFRDVPVGTYVITGSSRRYTIQTQIVVVNQDLSDVTLFAQPN